MLNLPPSTEVGKIVPKERFYAKEPSKTKDYFTTHIEKISWVNKISPTTLNISARSYPELQVFEVRFKAVDKKTNKTIRLIDSKIPYPVLFLVCYRNELKAMLSVKQVKGDKIVVIEQFETDWHDFEGFKLEMKGASVDAIYENYLYQITDKLNFGGSLEENMNKYKQIKALKTAIEKINRKIKKEPSVVKRQELARERNALEQSGLHVLFKN